MLLIYAALFLHIWHSLHSILYIDTEIIRQTYIWLIVVRFRSALRESLLYWNFKYIHEARIQFSMAICNEASRLRPNSLFFILLFFWCVCLSQVARARLEEECFCIYKTTLSNDWHQVNTTQATTLYTRIYCKYLYVIANGGAGGDDDDDAVCVIIKRVFKCNKIVCVCDRCELYWRQRERGSICCLIYYLYNYIIWILSLRASRRDRARTVILYVCIRKNPGNYNIVVKCEHNFVENFNCFRAY